MTTAEHADEPTDCVDEVDMAEYGRLGLEPRRAHRYLLTIDGCVHPVHQHKMSAVAVLDLVGKGFDLWILEVVLHGGDVLRVEGDQEFTLHKERIVEFRTVRRHHDHGHAGEVDLNVVVNGEPTSVRAHPRTLLGAVAAEALEIAKPVGRANDEWVLKDEAGNVLDSSISVHEAHLVSGSTLYLSLKTGAAGDLGPAPVVADPAVCQAKFDAEVASYRAIENDMIRRGQWMISAVFPKVLVNFAALGDQAIPVVAFGVELDFTNYDMWPPSVQIVHPFTRRPYRGSNLPLHAQLVRRRNGFENIPLSELSLHPDALERMMQWRSPNDIPFLCHVGVREYHEHPAHSGNDWLLHRGLGKGTLYHLLDLIHQLGPAGITGAGMTLSIRV